MLRCAWVNQKMKSFEKRIDELKREIPDFNIIQLEIELLKLKLEIDLWSLERRKYIREETKK